MLDLPSRVKEGGLFFNPKPSPSFPDHNITYMELVEEFKRGNMIIDIDGDLKDKEAVKCQEDGCLTSFKSTADQSRHYLLIHGKAGRLCLSLKTFHFKYQFCQSFLLFIYLGLILHDKYQHCLSS